MKNDKLAILCGGGPAPGLNGVIAAATLEATRSGTEVLGLRDGFKWLIDGDLSRNVKLTPADADRIHFRGGSDLGIARANPAKKPEHLAKCLETLQKLGVGMLVTVGGDDTCFSSASLARASNGSLRVVHVPKTIDNDLDLPPEVPTFGFQTARHVGTEILENLLVDAKTTSRWYFVVAMGRKAGHLALGIGKAAGAAITLIPEELGSSGVKMKDVVDTLVGSILKRQAHGENNGVAVLAEGIVEVIDPADIEGLDGVERDEHGHIRISEVDFGALVKTAVLKRLKELGVAMTIVPKNIGYELRCADPIPFDLEYTRDLGYCAARYLLDGGDQALISIQRAQFVPVKFDTIMDKTTGRMKVRMVDVASDNFKIARAYMTRLEKADLADETRLAKLAKTTKLDAAAFRAAFANVATS